MAGREIDRTSHPDKRWGRGQKLQASRLNELSRSIRRIITGVPPPRQLYVPPITVQIQQFKVTGGQAFSDVISVHTWDGSAEGEQIIYVMRPWQLRRSSFHEVTFPDGTLYTYQSSHQRLATLSSYSETQRITPAYQDDDVIYAMSGVIGASPTTIDDLVAGEIQVSWIDMNTDGRVWAREEAY